MDRKIIICGGLECEFTEAMKESGWVKSECTNYLTLKQLEYLKNIPVQ